MILLVIKVRQNVKLLMLSAFTLKIHIKSSSKIQTTSQTCKQFTKKGCSDPHRTQVHCRCENRGLATGQNTSPFLLASSLSFSISELVGHTDSSLSCVCVWEWVVKGERMHHLYHSKSLVATWFYKFSMAFCLKNRDLGWRKYLLSIWNYQG